MEKTKFHNLLHYLLHYGLLLGLLLPALTFGKELKLVADHWPPFTSQTKGQRIAVDLVEQALQRSGFPAHASIIEWKQVLDGVKNGKYDAIVGAWKNTEREQFLLFSRPYLQNRIMLVGRADNKLESVDIAQLENKKIGIVKDYAYGDSILTNKKIIKIESATVADNIKKLLDKKVDLIFVDSIVVQSIKDKLPEDVQKQLVIYPDVVAEQDLYFAVRKNYPGASALLDKFNHAISAMIADGSYNRILGFDWLIADTNDDGVDEYISGNHLQSKSGDPAQSGRTYTLFSKENDTPPKPTKKYRVLNLEYNSWDDAQQAINQAQNSGELQYEDNTSGAIGVFSGQF